MSDSIIPELLKPENPRALGVLGYLIVLNNQVHSYELNALESYLKTVGLNLEDTCLDAIIRGSDESVSLSSSREAFSNENPKVKLCLIYMMYVISCVDNHFAESENQYIRDMLKYTDVSSEDLITIKGMALEEAGNIRAQNNTIFIRYPSESRKTIWARIIAWIKKIINKLLGRKEPTPEERIGEYKEIIENCSEIANEDLGVVEPAYNKVINRCQDTIQAIEEYKRSLSLETGLSASVAKTIECFVEMLNTEVVDQTKKELLALEQKKNTISDFTISLLGRTKAGKSTLHSILTQQGRDRIGVGKQRTTRYNWVYQWNLLRIIDTPGVGSAEADGRKDEEIAESVLGESDIICFVVADDSILKDILEFIEKVAQLNKPVIILLNHKENIRTDVKFRRFIDKPDQWMNEKSESSLKGHENRIRKYANDRGFGKLVNVYPVFLLPALMSEESDYVEYRDLLWKSSNLDGFIDQISSWVLRSGRIKRSQTILDETANVFTRARESIGVSVKFIDDQISFLEKERQDKIHQLKATKNGVVDNIQYILEDNYGDLADNKALLFAEEYIGSGTRTGKDVGEKWVAYMERIQFEQNLRSEIDVAINVFKDKVDRTVKELFEDLFYSVNASLNVNQIDIPIQFDIKNVVNLTSSALGATVLILATVIGMSNPITLALSIVGVLGALLGVFLADKKTRRQKAIDKIYTTIRDEIRKGLPDRIKELTDQINDQLNNAVDNIDSVFKDLIIGLKWTRQMSDKIETDYNTEIEKTEKAYAWRIIQFLESKNEELDMEKIDSEIISVDRSNRDSIIIKTRSAHRVHTDILNTVLAEDIIIKRGA